MRQSLANSRTLVVIFSITIVVFATFISRSAAQDNDPVDSTTIGGLITELGFEEWIKTGNGGEGINVGVIDLGFRGVEDLDSRFGSDFSATRLGQEPDLQDRTTDHGTRVIEIMAAIAPQAEYFYCEYDGTLAGLTLCTTQMVNEDVRIITHAAGLASGSEEIARDWERVVELAASNNVLWVNSAGNFGTGVIRDLLSIEEADNGRFHFFRDSASVDLEVPPVQGNREAQVTLSWAVSGEAGVNAEDIDLQILAYLDGEPTDLISQQEQQGDPDIPPYDTLNVALEDGIDLRVRLVSYPGDYDADRSQVNISIELWVEFGVFEDPELESIVLPATSLDSLTIAALDNNNRLERAEYSSQGNELAFAAPGMISVFGDQSPFIGTSAAAPLVAAGAALLLDNNPSLSRRELFDELTGAVESGRGLFTSVGNGFFSMPTVPSILISSTPQGPIEDNSIPINPQPAASSPTPTATPTVPATPIARLLANFRVRSGPGLEYEIVSELSAEQDVTILGVTEDYEWYKVIYNDDTGSEGWIPVNEQFLQSIGRPQDFTLIEITVTCIITNTEVIPVYAGPGFDRARRGVLQTDSTVQIIGKANDLEGNLWWQLAVNLDESDNVDSTRFWIQDTNRLQPSSTFECEQIPFAPPPIKIVPVTVTPTPTSTFTPIPS